MSLVARAHVVNARHAHIRRRNSRPDFVLRVLHLYSRTPLWSLNSRAARVSGPAGWGRVWTGARTAFSF
jgi:hypothetical protein